MRTNPVLVGLALCLFAGATLAEEKYTIKLKTDPDVGKTITVQSRSTDENSSVVKILGPDGKLVKTFGPKASDTKYSLAVLSRKGQDEIVTRAYETASKSEDGKNRALSYQGRTVVFEKKDGVVRVGVVGKPSLTGDDLESLIASANLKFPPGTHPLTGFLPTGPVAVGATWDLDQAALNKDLHGFRFDPKQNRGTATLQKVYTRNGTQFGVIRIVTKLSAQEFDGVVFEPPLAVETTSTIDTAIDGTSVAVVMERTTRRKGTGTFDAGDKKLTLELRVETIDREETSAEKVASKTQEAPAVELAGPFTPWERFTSKQARFSICFPVRPKVETDDQGVSSFNASLGNNRQQVFNVLTAEKPVAGEPLKILTAFLGGAYPKIAKDKVEIEHEGHKGYELTQIEELPSGVKATTTMRFFYVGGRVYQISAGILGGEGPDNRKKYLDSFRILVEPKQPKEDKK